MQILIFFHILGAAVWVGGVVFLGAVLIPSLRGLDSDVRRRIISRAGRTFGIIAVIAFVDLVVTGILIYFGKGLTIGDLLSMFAGRIVLIKVVLSIVLVALTVGHVFYIGPKISSATNAPRGLRHASDAVSGLILVVSLALVWFGVVLAT
jgi:putative copper resistance protein D